MGREGLRRRRGGVGVVGMEGKMGRELLRVVLLGGLGVEGKMVLLRVRVWVVLELVVLRRRRRRRRVVVVVLLLGVGAEDQVDLVANEVGFVGQV